jgi:hypothetical protein
LEDCVGLEEGIYPVMGIFMFVFFLYSAEEEMELMITAVLS